MKTSIKWLKYYVDVPWGAVELAEKLTLAGLEVEGIETTGDIPEGVVVAEILTRTPHPDADRLSVCTVNAGSSGELQIVCGAPNCDVGKKVPLATVGTKLGEGFTIKKSKLRGVPSEGMLCAEDELGISDLHDGLMELAEDTLPGTPLGEILESDAVIDWEVTPNRPDWLSHIGIAREIAAVRGDASALTMPDVACVEDTSATADALTSVDVQDPDLCPRYIARIIRDVKIGPSPDWMQRALRAVGLRPINNIVDITNFVMLECGQPLHAFDYNLLAENRIVVRRARNGEKIKTLDDQEHELTAENLLICDGKQGVALAGVMGGANSEISDATTTVLLESACFNASTIRATSRALGISTDSSHRFERGIDIEMTDFASRRAAELMCSFAGGKLASGALDVYAVPYQPATVSARLDRINSLIGVDIPAEKISGFLAALGLQPTLTDNTSVSISVPPHRLDLGREADIIEEVARLYGLDNIPGSPARAQVGGMRHEDCYYPFQEAREQLLGLGLDETMTYSFVNPDSAVRATGFEAGNLVCPTNPLSNELGAMRPTLVPGLLQTVAHNIARNNHTLALFEMGRVVVHAPELPEERTQIGIILTGRAHPERFGTEKDQEIDFYDLKGILEGWLEARGVVAACTATTHPAFNAGTCAALSVDGLQLAVFGQANDALTDDMRLRHPVYMALVEFDDVQKLPEPGMLYQPLPPFPAIVRDISLVAPVALTNGEIMATIRSLRIDILEGVELFDIYENEEALGTGRKSMAYSITYRDPAKTLTDKRVNKIHETVRKGLADKLAVELR